MTAKINGFLIRRNVGTPMCDKGNEIVSEACKLDPGNALDAFSFQNIAATTAAFAV
jgi:hypothetical protein